jgi:hypothetical protein
MAIARKRMSLATDTHSEAIGFAHGGESLPAPIIIVAVVVIVIVAIILFVRRRGSGS